MARWNKNANLGVAFDQWFMNLFPRVEPFVANGGGYLTLSFIPTLGTMILGLLAGSDRQFVLVRHGSIAVADDQDVVAGIDALQLIAALAVGLGRATAAPQQAAHSPCIEESERLLHPVHARKAAAELA